MSAHAHAAAADIPHAAPSVDFGALWRTQARYDAEVFISLIYRNEYSAKDALIWLHDQECNNPDLYKQVEAGLEQLVSRPAGLE